MTVPSMTAQLSAIAELADVYAFRAPIMQQNHLVPILCR
jgi:hypothetical protein